MKALVYEKAHSLADFAIKLVESPVPTLNGTHFWTKETTQGPLWIIFWRTHQRLLEYLAKVATKRSGSPTR